MKSMVNYISPVVILAPAESGMPWDLFIYKAILLAVHGRPSVHIVIIIIIATVISSLIVHLYA